MKTKQIYYGLVRYAFGKSPQKVITFYETRAEAEFFLAMLTKKGADYKIEEIDKEGKFLEIYAQ